MLHTLEALIQIARVVTFTAERQGYHVGIIGSCLTKGSSEDDMDLVLYWHDGKEPKIGPEDLMDLLGYPYVHATGEDYSTGEHRMVLKAEVSTFLVDFMFLFA